ncbi:MAG TPA: DUF1501 domain-containing protein [Solirubrobacteraceae bacterium]|jgi:uncharacterized protein (DUF1501 family)
MPKACACNDFNRAQLLRKGVAAAGRGLPNIEPGMPIPAGTGMDRRTFMLRSAGAALSVYGASMLGVRHFEEGIAKAAEGPAKPVLVSIFMEGGWDAMSVLAPIGDARYTQLRPTLALKEGEGLKFTEDERLMWHPQAQGLATLHGEGKVSVLPAVGYDPPDESHFTSRHYWEVGQLDTETRSGWMGRLLDATGEEDNPLQGLSLDYSLAPALATTRVPVAAVSTPADYRLWAYGVDEPVMAPAVQAYGDLGALPAPSPAYAQARGASLDTSIVLGQMASFVGSSGEPKYEPKATYPTGDAFPERLEALAAMLHAGLPIRCVSLNGVGGYDTHSDEVETLKSNLGKTVESVLAFQRDLEARGLADRVLVELWSEFGRRPEENGSGTDHGAAGAAFLIGTRAKGEMVGEFPGLAQLDENENLRNTSDFRALYCSLVEQWFQTEAGLVIPNAAEMPRPVLVK